MNLEEFLQKLRDENAVLTAENAWLKWEVDRVNRMVETIGKSIQRDNARLRETLEIAKRRINELR